MYISQSSKLNFLTTAKQLLDGISQVPRSRGVAMY
jgi:hypothetical protein